MIKPNVHNTVSHSHVETMVGVQEKHVQTNNNSRFSIKVCTCREFCKCTNRTFSIYLYSPGRIQSRQKNTSTFSVYLKSFFFLSKTDLNTCLYVCINEFIECISHYVA